MSFWTLQMNTVYQNCSLFLRFKVINAHFISHLAFIVNSTLDTGIHLKCSEWHLVVHWYSSEVFGMTLGGTLVFIWSVRNDTWWHTGIHLKCLEWHLVVHWYSSEVFGMTLGGTLVFIWSVQNDPKCHSEHFRWILVYQNCSLFLRFKVHLPLTW